MTLELRQARACKPSEKEEWIAFLDECLGYEQGGGASYGTDFYPLFEDTALENSRIIETNIAGKRKIMASATLYPVSVKIHESVVRLGIIGAVATRPEYRGLGLSTLIINELDSSLATSLNLQGLILWSDQEKFYEKFGYKKIGEQEFFSLLNFSEIKKPHSKIEIQDKWNLSSIRKIYETHPCRIQRSEAYWNALDKITSTNKRQLLNQDGEVLAYLAFNRGKDLKDIVHEWGGEKEALLYLVSQTLKNYPNLIWMTNPHLKDPVSDILRKTLAPYQTHLALFKKLDSSLSDDIIAKIWFWGLDSL